MGDDIDLQLGRRLRRRRRLLGLTQEQLAKRCGLRFQQIQKYETATNKMSAGMIARLAQALSVEAGYFYEGVVVESGVEAARPRDLGRGRDTLANTARGGVSPALQAGRGARVILSGDRPCSRRVGDGA